MTRVTVQTDATHVVVRHILTSVLLGLANYRVKMPVYQKLLSIKIQKPHRTVNPDTSDSRYTVRVWDESSILGLLHDMTNMKMDKHGILVQGDWTE